MAEALTEDQTTHLTKLFVKLDKNGDGSITSKNFMNTISLQQFHDKVGVAMTNETYLKNLRKLVKKDLKVGKDGQISLKDLMHSTRKHEPQCENLIKSTDVNGDGVLTLDEYVFNMVAIEAIEGISFLR